MNSYTLPVVDLKNNIDGNEAHYTQTILALEELSVNENSTEENVELGENVVMMDPECLTSKKQVMQN